MNFDEYKLTGAKTYDDLAKAVAEILNASIEAEKGYRLHQVTARAKEPVSLSKKLEQRGIETTTMIENDIKDLAGCRVIFYTDSDITKLIHSGIISQKFDVQEFKTHYPRRVVEDAKNLYIANHYIVTLRPECIALPGYSRFTGMRCEIQIQTILNHAWAEIAHDTIYKPIKFGNFGDKQFKDIETRMQKVVRKYLVPAGHEFQKIATDFQQLVENKKIFLLKKIVDAADNNARAQALETFAKKILPHYNDLYVVYPKIVKRLIVAADRARITLPVTIETPYGERPAKTCSDIFKAIASILNQYRYLDIDTTFDALCRLYGWAGDENEREPLLDLGKALAKHDRRVWCLYGPAVQAILVERIEKLTEDECRGLQLLLTAMLREILGTEVTGTTSSSSTMMVDSGAVIPSDELRSLRTKAIDLLKRQFALVKTERERRTVLHALQAGICRPIHVGYSSALAQLLMNDTCTVLHFLTESVPALGSELLQTIEGWVHRRYWTYTELSDTMRNDSDPDFVAASARAVIAALAFRDTANANSDFVIYKTLVGFDSVFPPAWQDKAFDHSQAEAYRTMQVDDLLASVNETNKDDWFDRINRYAQTDSHDCATFSVFAKFLERLAEAQPTVVFGYIDRLEGPLVNFLPNMLAGLMRSAERAQALALIDKWLCTGKHVGPIACYLGSADPFDEALLRQVLDSAIQHNDGHAVRNVLVAAVNQFETHPGMLVEETFLPALRYLHEKQDLGWVLMQGVFWYKCPIILALDEEQASVVLNALVPYPVLENNAEYIVATIAKKWPARVVAFLGARQIFAQTAAAPSDYNAVPFEVHELRAPLSAVPDTMLSEARVWFDANPQHFTCNGGKLLASVFHDLSDGLKTRLTALIKGGNEKDLAFVLAILSAFEGKPCVFELVREIIATHHLDDLLRSQAQSVLCETGVVSGRFGLADLYADRKALIETWLADPSEAVQTFAAEQIREYEQRIAETTQLTEASWAQRKLHYGEELDGDGAG